MKDIDRFVADFEAGIIKAVEFPIMTICGSVRFYDDMLKWACHFSKSGYVIMMPHCFQHDHFHNVSAGQDQKYMLDLLHFRKIALSEYVFIVDKDGYIGESTSREIRVAKKLGKEILYASKSEVKI